MDSLAFHPKYVAPFYLDLMNLNFLNKSIKETDTLFSNLQLISKELQDKQLITMLNDSWRPGKVAAWVIGVSKRNNLLDELDLFLNNKGVHHSEHVLINLLVLKRQESKQSLIDFINRQIDYFMEADNKLVVENLSIEWAISILGYLDKVNKTNDVYEVHASERWQNFEKELVKIALSFYDAIRPQYEALFYGDRITELMKRIESL